MIVRFENILSKRSVTKNYSQRQIKLLELRRLWSVDDVVYWVVKVIPFESHYNVIISPLYAWQVMVVDCDWSVFEAVASDKIYSAKLTDRLCLRHDKTEPGMSDKSGNAIYLKTYKFDSMPKISRGDVFVFDNVSYVTSGFEVHKRVVGKNVLDRVVVVTHDVSTMFPPERHVSIVSSEHISSQLDSITFHTVGR